MSRKEFIDKHIDAEARAEFVRANAVAIVSDLEAQAGRYVTELRKLSKSREGIRRDVRRLQAERDRLAAALHASNEKVEQFDAFCETITSAMGHIDAKNPLAEVVMDKVVELGRLRKAIADVHAEHADDLCWMDIDRIFSAAGLPMQPRSVGDKAAMRKNCDRFIDTMCAGGKWLSYAELETALHAVRAHPWYSYSVVPRAGGPGGPVDMAAAGFELNPEFAAAPGDVCWRRRVSP